MGNSFFFVVIAIIIIGSIISSVMKNGDAKRRAQNANRQRPAPSPPKRKEGVDLADEIKSSQLRKQSPYKERVVEFAREKKHTHPSSLGNAKVEKVYVEDSMGEYQSEGCEEHYYQRFVSMTDDLESDSSVNKDIAKIIVLGEVINSPRFKHRR